MKIIELTDVSKTFVLGDSPVKALDRVTLAISRGEFVAVMGSSGSGKSTLMNVMGCLDRADSGEYLLEGVNVSRMDRDQLAHVRNRRIGFVFQGFNLLPRTSALENVELPLLYSPLGPGRESRQRAVEALTIVGLAQRVEHEPSQLSGGQQQRVAIARALVNDPAIILADEPTGNLDSATTLEVISLFKRLNQRGITIVLVTHEAEMARFANRIIELKDGRVIRDRGVCDGLAGPPGRGEEGVP
ncbi:MAG: ABC transporter ATP-binding protein [Desulfobacteraceae bacterium]|nr:ABC transporter ATP-binding protein [Desulfobacteraceae bacterium]